MVAIGPATSRPHRPPPPCTRTRRRHPRVSGRQWTDTAGERAKYGLPHCPRAALAGASRPRPPRSAGPAGGGVETKSFDIDLDKGSPVITAKNGQGDFPYKVSASDPEVFYVTVHTKAHDVRWDLTLDWSSGDRRGTEHIDNKGTPFRTSADAGRPGYDYPLGGGEWVERQE